MREADLLVSFGPVNRIPVELFRDRPAIFIDSDPIYLQLKLVNEDRSLAAILNAHTHHFTFGENIGKGGVKATNWWLYVAANPPASRNRTLGECRPARASVYNRRNVGFERTRRRIPGRNVYVAQTDRMVPLLGSAQQNRKDF